MDECPKCGSTEGYYHYIVERRAVFYDFSGKQIDVSGGITEKSLKRNYCTECHEFISTYKEQE